jgi:hypothetical protein
MRRIAHRWMKVIRSLRSFRSSDVGRAAQNVLALAPGVDEVHVLASSGNAAALSYECEAPVPFRQIDRGLDDIDVLRTETERGVGLPPLAYRRFEDDADPKRGAVNDSPEMPRALYGPHPS